MEYAKYVPTKQLDIAGLTSKLSEKIAGIGEERQKKREELDLQATEAIDLVSNPDMTTSQTANDVILSNTQKSVSQVNNWNAALKSGQMSPSEYKRRINNLTKQTEDLATAFKTFDDRYKTLAERQADRTGSNAELQFAEGWGTMSDIANAELIQDDNGNIFYKNKKSGQTLSLSALNRPENAIINRIDVTGEASKISEKWKQDGRFKDLGRGGSEEIKTFLNNPTSKVSIDMATQSIISSPKAKLSVLADYLNVPVELYSTPQEYEQKKAKLTEEAKQRAERTGVALTQKDYDDIEFRMVKMGIDEQQIKQPVLTKEQEEKIYKAVNDTLYSQIQTTIEGEAKEDWYHAPTGDSGKGLSQEDIIGGIELYKLTKNAFEQSKPGDNSRTNDYLRSAGEKANKFLVKTKKVENGKTTYPIVAYEYKLDELTGKPTKEVDWKHPKAYYQGKSLAEVVTGKPANEANTIWEIGNEYKDQIESTPLKKESSLSANQEANIKATMKANPGATREDVIKVLGY